MSASFDCGKAQTKVEKLICSDPQLSALDGMLDQAYSIIRNATRPEDQPEIIAKQKYWLEHTRNSCQDAACLRKAYTAEIESLNIPAPPSSTDKLVPFKKMETSNVCGFPGVTLPEDTVVLGAGGLGGKTVDFQIDQSGNPTTQIDVAVNSPEKPVALMLGASVPTIWNIGWTSGTHIVAVFASGYDRQRVAGLTPDTPLLVSSTVDDGPCSTSRFTYETFHQYDSLIASFKYGQVTDPAQAINEQKLSQILFARPITKIYSVPDEAGKVVMGSPMNSTQRLMTSAATPPKSFHDKKAPLAGQAGLDQATHRGILRRATLKDATRWIKALKKKYAIQNRPAPNIPPDLDNAYVVLKKFTYPPGLYGGHSATFYIPVGVPRPTGDFGHSRIYDLNSISLDCRGDSPCGKAIQSGAIGRGVSQKTTTYDFNGGGGIVFHESSGEQQGTPEPSAPRAVSLPRLGASSQGMPSPGIPSSTICPGASGCTTTTSLHVIGIYQSRSNEIDVNVNDDTRPVVLALTSYEQGNWRVNLKEGVKLKKVILVGYHSQFVTGLPPNTPIEVYTYDQSPCDHCWQGRYIIQSGEKPYQEPAVELEKITGLKVTTYQGRYQGAEFSIFPGMKEWSPQGNN